MGLQPSRPWRLITLAWSALAAALAVGSVAAAPTPQPPRRQPADDLIVLAYHEIADRSQAVMPDYAISPQAFDAQLNWLQGHGYHLVSLDQLLRARRSHQPLPGKPVLLSFDDGYSNVYSAAFPILRRHHAPAVVAVVGSWLEPTQGPVRFGDDWIPRERLLSWDQLRTMERSGLVEVISHSYDLHRGIPGNPQLNSMPAATTRQFSPQQGYETEGQYSQRLQHDLQTNASLLQRQLGHRPRAVAWPYGRYNATAAAIATGLGMPVGFSLDDGANTSAVPLSGLRRVLMMPELSTPQALAQELRIRRANLDDNSRAAKVMHVDLDNIDDPDPTQVERNLQLLLQRIRAMGVNTVYLQAFADPDGNGAADAVYFPNRFLPVKRDLFSHVAWEIRTRTPVRRVYAWMPVLAFELPRGTPGADQRLQTQPSSNGHLTMGYPRLSPFSAAAMGTVRGLYADLARSASFDGLLFHDDVTMSDYEDASPAALKQYRAWGLPTDLAAIRASDALLGAWTNRKTAALEALTLQLAQVVRANQPQLRTARNLYAQVVLNPHAEAWYSQSIDDAIRDYDFTAVMAMPWMERASNPDQFLKELVARVKERPQGLQRVLFELQSTDWNSHHDLSSQQLAQELQTLYRLGVRHTGYYPDNLHRGTPDPDVLRPVFQAHSSIPTQP
jgi:biofilm PGA synthesis lipoprotein PgaB